MIMTTNPMNTTFMNISIEMKLPHIPHLRHSGESRNPINAKGIPDFAGMTNLGGERLS